MRRYIAGSVVLLALAAWAGVAGAKPDKEGGKLVEKIPVKEVAGLEEPGSVKKPAVIESADAVAKVIPDEGARKAILDRADFKKQVVLVFRWAGSGQDRLTATAADGKVVFQHTPGLTRDLRQHAAVFAVAKGAKWEVKSGR